MDRMRQIVCRLNCVCLCAFLCNVLFSAIAFSSSDNIYRLHENFENLAIKRIAVLPMSNMSFEDAVNDLMYESVMKSLNEKGYIVVSKACVEKTMSELGVQVSGQIEEILPDRLGKMLNVDAYIVGGIDQSADMNVGVYDAVVVSCSLGLVSCKTHELIWVAEQWRTAKRSVSIDPINIILNRILNSSASREKRIKYLVHSMLEKLPRGPVQNEDVKLLEDAAVIQCFPE